MPKQTRTLLSQFAWLGISFAAATVIYILCFGARFRKPIDIYLHDTVFVVEPFFIIVLLILLLTFITFFFKERAYRFSRAVPNTFILIAGLLNIVFFAFAYKTLIPLRRWLAGWTAHPPLSALAKSEITQTESPVVNVLLIGLMVFELIIVLILLYFSYQWGRHRKVSAGANEIKA